MRNEAKTDIDNGIDCLNDLIKTEDIEEDVKELATEAIQYLKDAIYEVENLERAKEDSERDLQELEGLVAIKNPFVDMNGMIDQMKADLLLEHWESISLEDIDAICPRP